MTKKEMISIVKRAIKMIELGFACDEDVYGIDHNEAVDLVDALLPALEDQLEKESECQEEELVYVSKIDFDTLRDRDLLLTCLEVAGVDSWEGMEDAVEVYESVKARGSNNG